MKIIPAIIFLLAACWGKAGETLPAHSHNDYEQKSPLHTALQLGFRSIEADLFFTNNALLVAHEPAHLNPARTLEALYLRPLLEYSRTNTSERSLILLVDIKTEAELAYLALTNALQPFHGILTSYEGTKVTPRLVTIIISGNRPRALIEQETFRHAAIDGRLSDLGSNVSPALMPLVSDNWTKFFKWQGAGSFPAEEREKLRRFVEQAHAEKKLVRFWATPDNPQIWEELARAGVDLINVDNLDAFASWYKSRSP